MPPIRSCLAFLLLGLLGCGEKAPTTTPGLGNSSGDGDGDEDLASDGDDNSDGDGDDDDLGNRPPLDCGDTIVRAQPVPADILIVQDRSSSMIGVSLSAGVGTDRWTPSTGALKKVLSEYDENVRFGLLLFPSKGQSCDKGSLNVPLMEKAGAKIGMALDQTPPAALIDGIGQTPTDLALKQALQVIDERAKGDFETTILPDGYVLLVTDGAPGCNLGATEQPRVDASNAVIDQLLKKGVKTYVIGYDIDAAGQAIMNEFAKRGGTNAYIPVGNGDSLEKALRDITAGSVPCKFQLPGKPSSDTDITVQIDGQPITVSAETGWTIDGQVVSLNGPSCSMIRDGVSHDVQVSVPCGALL